VSDYESSQARRDVIVGLFVILGLGALGWMIFKFGDLPTAVSRMKSFQVLVQFPTAPGVQKDTPVQFCGYQIGRVTEVMAPRVMEDLNDGRRYHQTKVVLSIDKDYTDIPANVQAKLMTRGLGSSYIELKVDPDAEAVPLSDPNGTSTNVLKQGVLLQGSTGMTSEFFPEESQKKLTSLVDAIGTFIQNANDIIGDPNSKRNVKDTLVHMSDATANVAIAMKKATEVMENAEKTLDEFRTLAITGTETLESVEGKADRLVTSLVNTSGELGKAISQLRLAMEKINQGRGTAGRLVNDARLYEKLLESTEQLNVLLSDFKDLIDTVSEKGLRSIY
jgi:phospholipid/cholesterol/gamma-HCH transport system substrate-binding protein